MKIKIVSLIISLLSLVSVQAQITKSAAGLVIFSKLYGVNADPFDYPASQFPNPYIDLSYTNNNDVRLQILSYLDYDDGVSVYHRHTPNFDGSQFVQKCEAIRMIFEAWNIPPSSTAVPYTDVNNFTWASGYIRRAYSMGLIPYSSNFNPYSFVDIDDFLDWIDDIGLTSYHPVSQSVLKDIDNYYIPNNFRPENLSLYAGIQKGVFDHYAKNSFVIPDVKLNLNFSHYYSSKMAELPTDLYPIRPLAKGWTHTYNAYIYTVDGGSDDYFYIVWPDGTIHIYNDDENEYESIGVYDDFDEKSSTRIVITTKDQTEYEFRKLDTDRDIYYLYEIEDQNGNDIAIRYENAEEDDTKRIEYVEAPSGKKLYFDYLNDFDLIDKITDPINRKIFFEYSGTSSSIFFYRYPVLVSFEDAKSNRTTYQYSGSNALKAYLLHEIELPRGNKITADYSNDGKLEEYRFNDNKTEIDLTYEYTNGSFEISSKVEIPVAGGGTTDLDYDYNANGLLKHYQDDNNELTIDYSTSGSKIALPSDVDYNNVETEYTWDSDGNLTEREIENDIVEYWYYNSDNDVTRYIDGEGNSTYYYYDSNGNLTSIKDALGNYSYFTYDSDGQMTSAKNQEGITVYLEYESDGAVSRITAPLGTEITRTYDGVNRLLTSTVNGLTSSRAYDKNDNVVSYTNSMNYTTGYDYDANDNLTTVTNAKNNKTYLHYDNKDRLDEIEFGPSIKEYKYDSEGYLEYYEKPDGTKLYYDYDNDGRITDIGDIEISYDSKNRIEELENTNGKLLIDYDKFGRVDKVVDGFNNNASTEYLYYDNGLLSRIICNDGLDVLKISYYYDANKRLTSVGASINGIYKKYVDYIYLKDGRLSQIQYPNDIVTYYNYDSLGRLTNIRHYNTKDSINKFYSSMQRDIHGNITRDSVSYNIGYTGYIPGSSPNYYPITYSYNNQNRITKREQPNDFSSPTVDNYYVNVNGNLESENTNVSYTYNIFDDLTEKETDDIKFNYKYNALGQRIESKREYKYRSVDNHTTTYVRDIINDNVLIEHILVNGTTYKKFLIQGLGIVAEVNDTTTRYFHYDSRGSTVIRTDPNGDVKEDYRYDENGRIIRSLHRALGNRYCYVGQFGVEYEDGELMYMRNRYYHTDLGRFLSEDPVWSTNLYPYADNNPINRIDPMGTNAESPNFDVTSTGLSGSAIVLGGFTLGVNANYINTGEHASRCPIYTIRGGIGGGYSLGANVLIGGYAYDGLGDFQPEYLNSKFMDNSNIEAEFPGIQLGINYSLDQIRNGGTVQGIFGTLGLGTGAASYSKGWTGTLLNTNKIFNYFGSDYCKIK